ncbi:MAG: hypothetical protein IBJ15_04975 [Alphaproteobacteria bacterium]|nr:hypothetical protein [Alphaproteobacteria bacterium]
MTGLQILGVLFDNPVFMLASAVIPVAFGYGLAKHHPHARLTLLTLGLALWGGAIAFWGYREFLDASFTDKDSLRKLQAAFMCGVFIIGVGLGILFQRAQASTRDETPER